MLNDAVGGVTVTIPTEGMEKTDPAFVKGTQVTLQGEQAERFVRFRDTTEDNSALYRMDQHEEYILQFFQALKIKSREDSQIVTHLFDLIQDYMVTDMAKADYLKIGADALTGGLTSADILTLPGNGMAGADSEPVLSGSLEVFTTQ
jgi:anionic cell wall polymer biosynthesis LytR-Cps2A-Psr (LCP) family protein